MNKTTKISKITLNNENNTVVDIVEIYNPDYKYIYKKCGYEQGLLAFECFEFEDEYKLVVFENKVINLAFRNELIEDEEKKKIYLKKVEKLITVCK